MFQRMQIFFLLTKNANQEKRYKEWKKKRYKEWRKRETKNEKKRN